MLYHQSLLWVPETIWMELNSRYYNDLLAGHFGIKKTHAFLARKYHLPILWHNIEAYVKSYDVCLALKAV